jgi:acyl carrier protein phosphodiesterase
MIEQDWLAGYGSAAGVDRTVERIATRLSRNGDTMTAGLDTLWRNEATLQDVFAGFFPELQAYVERQRSAG